MYVAVSFQIDVYISDDYDLNDETSIKRAREDAKTKAYMQLIKRVQSAGIKKEDGVIFDAEQGAERLIE